MEQQNRTAKILYAPLGESFLGYWKLAVVWCLRGEMHLYYSQQWLSDSISWKYNQEEADTKMLLHVKHISPLISNTFIYTLDTDVFVIALTVSTERPTILFNRRGAKSQARIISTEKVKQSLCPKYAVNDRELAAKSILKLHTLTGCDRRQR